MIVRRCDDIKALHSLLKTTRAFRKAALERLPQHIIINEPRPPSNPHVHLPHRPRPYISFDYDPGGPGPLILKKNARAGTYRARSNDGYETDRERFSDFKEKRWHLAQARRKYMAERLFRIKVIDLRFIQQWAVDEFTTDTYGFEKSPYQLEVARVWSWPTPPHRDYFDEAGEHLQIDVPAVVAFFWPPPGWKAPQPNQPRAQRHRSYSFDSDSGGSLDGDASWTQRRVSAKRYVLNMDLGRPVDNLPDVTSDLWLDVFDRPSETTVVFHPRAKGKWTAADLARLRATVACVIEHALGCSSVGGDVTLVGTEHLPAAVFPLQKLVWSDGGVFRGELVEVDGGKLAAAKSVEAVLAAAGDPHPVELASMEEIAKERGAQWRLETCEDYFLGNASAPIT
jgi:hypothetical protein